MRYMCLVHVDPALMGKLSQAEDARLVRDSLAYDEDLRRSGHFITASALKGPETAVIVRVRESGVSVTDGPYVETKEHLGGFIFIEARDLNDAIAVATRIPMARMGSIEVRPELEM